MFKEVVAEDFAKLKKYMVFQVQRTPEGMFLYLFKK